MACGMHYYILRLTINEEIKTMVKAIAKSIIMMISMFFGGILIAALFAMIAQTEIAVILGLGMGSVLGLLIGYATIICYE